MNFRSAVLKAIEQTPNLKGTNKKIAARAKVEKHPLLWKALQAVVTHRYERDTGEQVGAGFDFSTIIQWLIDNMPAILAFIKLIFGI